MSGRNRGELHDAAWERSLDSGLREVVGGERAPDVTAAVSARHAAGEVVDGGGRVAPASPFRQRWLAAALLLLGAAAVVATLVANRAGSRPTAAGSGPGVGTAADVPSPDAQEPVSVVIRKAEQRELPLVLPWTRIAALPDLQEVEARNLDDAQLAALVAQCPQLTRLRVVAIKGRRGEDPPEPVSITDAAFASIAKLSKLQRLDLVLTDGVHGEGLRALDALPLLRELSLSGFDVDDQGLAVLPRLPSLQVLRLVLNHGFGAAGIDAIAQCPGLRTLELRGCSQLRADWIARLGALPGLLELDLSNIGSTWRVATTPAPAEARAAERRRVEVAARAGAGMRTEAIAGWPKLQRIMLADTPGLGADVGQALRTKCPSLQYVALSGCNDVDDTTVAELLGLRQLRTLDLARCPKVTAASFDLLKLAQQLREVRFADCDWLTLEKAEQLLQSGKRVVNPRGDAVYDRALQRLHERFAAALAHPSYVLVRELDKLRVLAPDIEYIEVRGLGDEAALLLAKRQGLRGVEFVCEHGQPALTDVGLRVLAGIRSLQELSLFNAKVSAGGFAELAALRELDRLSVSVTALDDDALQVLPKLPALRVLELTGVRSFADRGAEAIAACTGLRRLSLRCCDQLGSGSLARLGALTALEELDLSEVPGVDDAALLALRSLAQLRELDLNKTSVTARGTAALAGMHALRTLHLDDCKGIDDDALLQVPVGVEVLALGNCPGLGTRAGAILRDRFPGLRSLSVRGNQWVDDAALGAILELPKLEYLAVFDCGHTTAASLPHLLAAPSLLKLEAMRLGWLTKEAVEQLRAAKPNLQVSNFVW